VTDTLKKADNGLIGETVPRDGLFRAQTPQLFLFDKLFEAHKAAPQGLTDDAAVAEQAGLQVQLVAGEAQNIKLTTEEDFTMNTPFLPRTGSGFDVHRFDEAGSAKEIMLCGVPVPHNRKIIGHSDADVGLHALTDAILGGLAEGDIGDHFPPSDTANKDRASSEFLTHALALATAKRARLTHIDLTLICEAPKIGPHRDAMRAGLSALTGLPLSAVSVKATTTEGLGFTGRGEGIAAQATATLLISGE
jgi:2-C-methyl-D-erythritol 4-phosphate cytidylyltransferase/2-C-methyl-D-erythritol 2,4-cyclodiphosphate synthase